MSGRAAPPSAGTITLALLSGLVALLALFPSSGVWWIVDRRP